MILYKERSVQANVITKLMAICIVICFATFILLLKNMLGNNGYATLLHVLAPFLSICLIAVMIFFYIKRASFISLQLMYAFAFSLIIGVPGIYLLNFRNPVKGFEIVCLWAILLNIVLYFCSYNNKTITQRKKVNKYFVVIFVIVGICQLIKTGLYFIFIVNSGVGHLAIYTEGDALVSQVPFVIRAISGMSLIMSLATFYYRASTGVRWFSFLLLASELLIGIRSKFFFSLICIIILSLYCNKELIKKKFLKISRLLYLVIGFVLFSLVSYYREGYDINFVKYMVIVLDSLSSTLAGLQDIFVLPDSQGWNRLDPHLIITQLFPISGLGFLNSTQIYKEFSVIVLGDISSGIALSSSGILESTILDVDFNFFIYLSYLLLMLSLIQHFLNSPKVFLNFIAIAMLPGFLYSIRGELILPIAYIIKSSPIIIVSNFLVSDKNADE